LQGENTELQQTIDRFMKELQKLNIGSDNTVDPQLQEGPLDFVGRFWEKVKPRDTGVVVSEHVGEIKKPGVEDEDSPKGGEKVRQVVQNVVENVGPQVSNLWGRGLGAWQNLQQKLREPAEAPQPKKVPKKKKKPEGESQRAPDSGPAAAATAEAPVVAAPEKATDQAGAPAAASSSTPAAAEAPAEAPASSTPKTEVKSAAAPKEEPKAAADDASQGATEEISSTILIEAKLTLDDGSVQIIQVRAADRCKEVAKNFIQEHSMKAWFTEPLTKFLKQVESDAVKFPVHVEGDILEIRKLYGKNA